MNVKAILTELDEVIEKLKAKIVYLQEENRHLRIKIVELKKFIQNL